MYFNLTKKRNSYGQNGKESSPIRVPMSCRKRDKPIRSSKKTAYFRTGCVQNLLFCKDPFTLTKLMTLKNQLMSFFIINDKLVPSKLLLGACAV